MRWWTAPGQPFSVDQGPFRRQRGPAVALTIVACGPRRSGVNPSAPGVGQCPAVAVAAQDLPAEASEPPQCPAPRPCGRGEHRRRGAARAHRSQHPIVVDDLVPGAVGFGRRQLAPTQLALSAGHTAIVARPLLLRRPGWTRRRLLEIAFASHLGGCPRTHAQYDHARPDGPEAHSFARDDDAAAYGPRAYAKSTRSFASLGNSVICRWHAQAGDGVWVRDM